MEILYTSADLHRVIKTILDKPVPKERRVVIVAFIGGSAEAFLPNPDGLEIVCCLRPGATSAVTIGRLLKRKAKIFKSERLHMKVYWSSLRGCVICSANASGNALGGGSQKEAGAWFEPGVVDIERLLAYAKPKPIKPIDLKRLGVLAKAATIHNATGPKEKVPDFLEWLTLPGRSDWKLGWWDVSGDFSKNAVEMAKKSYDVKEPADFINVKKGQVTEGDWVLSFRIPVGKMPKWLSVDHLVSVPSSDKGAYEKDYPFQAVQVHASDKYPNPPFRIDKPFNDAFKKAAKAYGENEIESLHSLEPPMELLDIIAENLRKASEKA